MNCGLIASARRRTVPAGTLLVGATAFSGLNAGGGLENFNIGSAFTAVASGTPTKMYLRGSTSSYTGMPHRLCIYHLGSSLTDWSGGTLVGYSEEKTALPATADQEYLMVTTGAVVAGDIYGLTIHGGTGTNFGCGRADGIDQRYFADTYADGPLATSPATAQNSPQGIFIYAKT